MLMNILITLLNLPWSIIGLFLTLFSLPKKVRFSKNPPAVIFYIRSLWWYRWLPSKRGVRAITNGHVVQMSDEADELDLKHELIHVEQNIRYPFVSGFVMLFEQILHGSLPPKNKFEKEAYERSGNRFL